MRHNLSFVSCALFLVLSFSGNSQTIELNRYPALFRDENLTVYQIKDTLFSAKQNIFVAEMQKEAYSRYHMGIAYSDTLLKKTSQFGEENKATLALNGSFFDVEKGGSVAYIESNGKVIAGNRNANEKWAKTDSLLNGAIIVDHSGRWKVETAKPAAYYEKSQEEKSVLVSGPILLEDGQILPMENSSFVKKRHPRSCLCLTSDHNILFIAIDGRSEIASGMNLKELQLFLLRLKCTEAINLDGGGSTTLWINDGAERKILNNPSDEEGERPVANILYIQKK